MESLALKEIIPFSIEEAQKPGRNVIRKDGRNVRIVCWNFQYEGKHNVIAIVPDEDYVERAVVYKENGIPASCNKGEISLVIERERNIKWMNLYKNKIGMMFSPTLYKSRTDAEEAKSEDTLIEGKLYSYYDTVMVIFNEEK